MASEGPQARPGPSKAFKIVASVLVLGGLAALGLFLQHRQTETRNRIAYNEARVRGSLNTLATSQMLLFESDRDGNGVADYGTLADLARHNYVDVVFASGTLGGYQFDVQLGADPKVSWWASADPSAAGITGERHFYVDQRGQIYVSQASIAGPLPEPPPAGVELLAR